MGSKELKQIIEYDFLKKSKQTLRLREQTIWYQWGEEKGGGKVEVRD